MGQDLVLCATKEGINSIREMVMALCNAKNVNYDSIKFNYKTIASYLVNGNKKYDTVFIDEYLMVHAGFIGLVTILSCCTKLFVLGDKNQIPFIDRLNFVNMRYFDPAKFISVTKFYSLTYRCPADVVLSLSNIYSNFKTASLVKKSVTFKDYLNISSIPILDHTLYLTFTKKDKYEISASCKLPDSSRVLTIHEAQGLKSKNVVCIRLSSNHCQLYSSLSHIIVALTRHTESFCYIKPKECIGDILMSYIKKSMWATEIEISNFQSNLPQANVQFNHIRKSKVLNGCLSLYFQNVNKMSSKASEFQNFVIKTNFSCYIICETNLKSHHLSSEFFPSDYVVYRCDRSNNTSVKTSGGGVLIGIKSNIPSIAVTVSNSKVEIVGVKVKLTKLNAYIFVVYIPPQSDKEKYINFCEVISEACVNCNSNDIVLIFGDFNLPNIIWNIDSDSNSLLPSNITSDIEMSFLDTILALGFQQINHVSNSSNKWLDLIFSNETNIINIAESSTPFVINDIHHKALEVSVRYNQLLDNNNHKQTELRYNFNKVDEVGLTEYLKDIDWDNILQDSDINKCVDQFYNSLYCGFEVYVPIMKSSSINYPPWYDNILINLKNLKNKAYRKMLLNRNILEYVEKYKECYNDFTMYYNSKFKEYLENVQEQIKTNPKYFWKYFNSKRQTTGFPSTMTYGDKSSNDSKEIADMFSDFFQSVYKPEDIDETSLIPNMNNNTLIDIPQITEEHVIAELNHFGLGCGPDRIPSNILKKFSTILAQPLTMLFNKSLNSGIFPEKWKLSKITPIFKSGPRSDVSNYRGISNTSSIPKLFEAVIVNLFKDKLSRVISVNQHGFLPGKSTTTNLVEFTHFSTNSIEDHKQVDVIHTDFCKAFDSCSHANTLKSLYDIGFSMAFILWIKSYLTNRLQYVTIGNSVSKIICASSGVPQGTHFGPWFFIVFIDNLTEVIKNSKVLFFADDMKLYKIIDSYYDTILLQEDIDRISEWCENKKLELNIGKCKTMSLYRKVKPIQVEYFIKNTKLTRIDEVKDLGVTFTHNLTFNKHIDIIIAKANQMLGFVKRWTKDISDINCLMTLYCSLIRSQLEYAVPVWNPYYETHIKRIENIQKKFLVHLYFKFTNTYDSNIPFFKNVLMIPPYRDRCQDLQILSLEDRRKYLLCIFIFNIIQGNTHSPSILENINFVVPAKSLRNTNFLHIARHRTNYGMHEPINAMSKLFNDISDLFDFNYNKSHFKNLLKSHYLNSN